MLEAIIPVKASKVARQYKALMMSSAMDSQVHSAQQFKWMKSILVTIPVYSNGLYPHSVEPSSKFIKIF